MKILSSLDALVERIINPILTVVGLAVALMLAYGIFSRAVIGKPVFGLEELTLMGAMWFYMLGAVLASRDRSHLCADFVQVMTSNRKIHRAASLLSTVISLGVAVMFVTWAWDLLSFGLKRGQITPVFGISQWISQASLFIASIAFVIYLIRDLILELSGRDISSGDPSSPTE